MRLYSFFFSFFNKLPLTDLAGYMNMSVSLGIRKCLSNKKKKRVRKVNQITNKLWYRNDFTFNGNMHNVDLNLQKADAFHSAQILHDTSNHGD